MGLGDFGCHLLIGSFLDGQLDEEIAIAINRIVNTSIGLSSFQNRETTCRKLCHLLMNSNQYGLTIMGPRCKNRLIIEQNCFHSTEERL